MTPRASSARPTASPGTPTPPTSCCPTLADLWYEETGGQAWVGEIGYQVWHLGMMGYGGRDRADGSKPVGVYWDEETTEDWAPHNPDLYRLPAAMPGRANGSTPSTRRSGMRRPIGTRSSRRKGARLPAAARRSSPTRAT